MNQTYILIDGLNLLFRSRHSTRGTPYDKLGLSLHIIFNAIKKAWYTHNGTHIILATEGRSWRKDFYNQYKLNRQEARAALTEEEQEEDKLFFEAYNDFLQFMNDKTNCTVLHHPQLEADDLIAGWIQNHPDDNHIIISTDSDFYQLIKDNVSQYNGVTDQFITKNGIYDNKGNKLSFTIQSNAKIKIGIKDTNFIPPEDWTEYALFLKIIRGDPGDFVFSAYPGVRLKGTKKSIGVIDAFNDRKTKGFNYNNFMLQKWQDHKGIDHLVLDDYERNKRLIDLTYQPDNIRQIINETIKQGAKPKSLTQVGIKLLKFCETYDLKKISENIQQFGEPFQAKYPE